MTKFFIVLLFFLSIFIAPYVSAEEPINEYAVETFLENREVLGIIEFSKNSDKLSTQSKKYLDRLASSIKKAQVDNMIIRFEGNIKSSLDNHSDVQLAMYRAKAVQDYLRNNHYIGNLSFLSGSIQNVRVSTSERVEIAIYNDNFNINSKPTEELKTTEFRDGLN